MKSWQAIIGGVLALGLLSGCGARTELGWFEPGSDSEDADLGPESDVFDASFPCVFSPAGAPVPVRDGPDHSLEPRLSWGHDRFALSFLVSDSPSAQTFGVPSICTTSPEEDFRCQGEAPLGEYAHRRAPLSATDNGWVACWSMIADAMPPSWFRRVDSSGSPEGEAGLLTGSPGNCADLVWTGEGSIMARLVEPWLDDRLEAVELSAEGELLAVAATVDGPLVFGSLATDADQTVMAWNDPEQLWVRHLGSGGGEVVHHPGGDLLTTRVALRWPLAGVLWLANVGSEQRLSFTVIEVDRGVVGGTTEISRGGELHGHAVVAVDEGFVVAWSERREERLRVVSRAIRVEGWEPTAWSEHVLHDATETELEQRTHDPTLAYDGRAVMVGFSLEDRVTGRLQVHLQQLDCHR